MHRQTGRGTVRMPLFLPRAPLGRALLEMVQAAPPAVNSRRISQFRETDSVLRRTGGRFGRGAAFGLGPVPVGVPSAAFEHEPGTGKQLFSFSAAFLAFGGGAVRMRLDQLELFSTFLAAVFVDRHSVANLDAPAAGKITAASNKESKIAGRPCQRGKPPRTFFPGP